MLSLLVNSFKICKQEIYDELCEEWLLVIHQVACPKCGIIGKLIIHGYYFRYYGIGLDQIELEIMRLKCKHCKSTHALLPSCILAYNYIPAETAVEVLHDRIESNMTYAQISEKYQIETRSLVRLIKHFEREYQLLHHVVFGATQKLAGMTGTNFHQFYKETKLLYLVKRSRLSRLFYSFCFLPPKQLNLLGGLTT